MSKDISKPYSFSIYLTPRAKKKLESIVNCIITIVEAPTGFGKTTLMKYYSSTRNWKANWIDIRSNTKEIFWEDLCDTVSEDLAEQFKQVGFPQSDKQIAMLRTAIMECDIAGECYIFIDNYHNIADIYSDMFLDILSEYMTSKCHLIIITQALATNISFDLTLKKTVLNITREDLEFMPEDIMGFYKAHNIEISVIDAQKIYDYTEGWISAIYLQMISYYDDNTAHKYLTIDRLVDKSVWSKLNTNKQNLMIALSRIDGFSLREAKKMTDDKELINTMDKILASVFFVRYDQNTKLFYMHHIFISFLIDRFDEMTVDEQKLIIIRTGSILEERGRIIDALKHYYGIGEWELIYRTTPSFNELYPFLNKENKDFFMSIIYNCPHEIRQKYHLFTIIMCLVLFAYSEKDRLYECLMETVFSIEEDVIISDRLRRNLLGTVYYVRGYTEVNNISIMNYFYKKSLEYTGAIVIGLTSNTPFTYGCPSVLHIYHTDNELFDNEIMNLNECMPNYYRLSDGHGKGAEALFKAEALFNKGNIKDAEILCHKAHYMADSRDQKSIYICAHLLMTRMSVFEADYTLFCDNMDSFNKEFKTPHINDQIYSDMIDMCWGFMYIQLDEKDKTANWLKSWETIEERHNIIAISYANIIYGKWLILEGEYEKFLGISGQFLGVASVYSMVMPAIYTYIYISIANLYLGNTEKAVKMLDEAIIIAKDNDIIMPFVENYSSIKETLENLEIMIRHHGFIKNIKQLEENYSKGIRIIQKNMRNKINYGLTNRELDVAKLAAKRYSNKEIADQLFIAESTVKSNLKIIFNKLEIGSRTELHRFF